MFELPNLPYDYNALEPHIDENTMRIHHTKHHQGYVNKLNAALEKHKGHEGHVDFQKLQIHELLQRINEVPDDIKQAVINNGGGHANHSLYWEILSDEKKDPKGAILEAIKTEFGTYEKFSEEFKKAATGRFGSGWAWLVVNQDADLEIISTKNQDSPWMEGKKPVLGIDVWEHAYYLNYQNKRPEYVDAFLEIINWDQVNHLYKEFTN